MGVSFKCEGSSRILRASELLFACAGRPNGKSEKFESLKKNLITEKHQFYCHKRLKYI